jgi:hypothetical protein
LVTVTVGSIESAIFAHAPEIQGRIGCRLAPLVPPLGIAGFAKTKGVVG